MDPNLTLGKDSSSFYGYLHAPGMYSFEVSSVFACDKVPLHPSAEYIDLRTELEDPSYTVLPQVNRGVFDAGFVT